MKKQNTLTKDELDRRNNASGITHGTWKSGTHYQSSWMKHKTFPVTQQIKDHLQYHATKHKVTLTFMLEQCLIELIKPEGVRKDLVHRATHTNFRDKDWWAADHPWYQNYGPYDYDNITNLYVIIDTVDFQHTYMSLYHQLRAFGTGMAIPVTYRNLNERLILENLSKIDYSTYVSRKSGKPRLNRGSETIKLTNITPEQAKLLKTMANHFGTYAKAIEWLCTEMHLEEMFLRYTGQSQVSKQDREKLTQKQHSREHC